MNEPELRQRSPYDQTFWPDDPNGALYTHQLGRCHAESCPYCDVWQQRAGDGDNSKVAKVVPS